jgi:hypothetical protein
MAALKVPAADVHKEVALLSSELSPLLPRRLKWGRDFPGTFTQYRQTYRQAYHHNLSLLFWGCYSSRCP